MKDILDLINRKYNALENKYFESLDLISKLDLKNRILEKEKKILENKILDLERINQVYKQNCKIDIKA